MIMYKLNFYQVTVCYVTLFIGTSYCMEYKIVLIVIYR